ncbi:DUF2177 family protein [Bdellovibrio sp. HCB209]|uniref:DUF2177 family protein n=1 Tax=Bdellovibrio sp. HCB209 TaxID=3394354 RepID=UPI0039B66813
MMVLLKSFLISFASFAILDFIWLGFIMKDFNMRQLSELGRIENGQFNVGYGAAVVVYIMMGLAITFFVREKVLEIDSYLHCFAYGAFLGLIVYGIYDFTNLAILKNYPLAFALVDVAWGTFLFGTVTIIVKKMGI